ncbi:MAG: family 20 glycosylhydrolase [Candidatus Promineifilaceae bacterium]|nr:family 20 glycosylhydrolase [Candidatus Promineifilaceae bacterium]
MNNSLTDELQLLPRPQSLVFQNDEFSIECDHLIAISGENIQENLSTALRLRQSICAIIGYNLEIDVGLAPVRDARGIYITVATDTTRHPQGYRITIAENSIRVIAGTPVGLCYGVNTLIQILRHYGRKIPGMMITDWPDYPVRGVLLDISRNKIPAMETLYWLVDLFASWKVNQLQLYSEHTFAYRNHPTVWAETSPMTGEQILRLDQYCRERHIDLVPNQNSFGHMHRWLQHAEYNHLAECPQGCEPEAEEIDEPFSLCPEEPASLELLRSLYDELLPHFSSRLFNVGCDETFDVGLGKSAKSVKERGSGRIYLEFLKKIINEVSARNRIPQFWGDIIVKYPELVKELPPDVIALEWGYESNHPFDEHARLYMQSGIPYYVCPGTSSWNSIAGRTSNAYANLSSASSYGLKYGAIGYLNTDWGDNGHWQPLSVSFIGFANGAALSWAFQANVNQEHSRAISRDAFCDDSGILASIANDLGDVHLETGVLIHNETVLFDLLQTSPENLGKIRNKLISGSLNQEGLVNTRNQIAEIADRLPESGQGNPAFELNLREMRWVVDVLDHACNRGLWMLAMEAGADEVFETAELTNQADRIVKEFDFIWHARNREGGFAASLALFERMRADYLNPR